MPAADAIEFEVRVSAVEIVRGPTARRKLIRIRGDVNRLSSRLNESRARTA